MRRPLVLLAAIGAPILSGVAGAAWVQTADGFPYAKAADGYDFERLEMNPTPPSRIPIWVGGISDPALRRAARNDGWLSDLQSTQDIADSIAKVRQYRAELGRENEPLDVMASASDAADLDGYRRLGDAGVTYVLTVPWVFYHGATDSLDKKIDGAKRYGEDVIAKMR